MLAELRRRPRPLKGRCGGCADKSVCGGNPRILALQFTGHPWAEDPACHLDDAEIGSDTVEGAERVTVTPFGGMSHDPAHFFLASRHSRRASCRRRPTPPKPAPPAAPPATGRRVRRLMEQAA